MSTSSSICWLAEAERFRTLTQVDILGDCVGEVAERSVVGGLLADPVAQLYRAPLGQGVGPGADEQDDLRP
jgi:hypothetical protein